MKYLTITIYHKNRYIGQIRSKINKFIDEETCRKCLINSFIQTFNNTYTCKINGKEINVNWD